MVKEKSGFQLSVQIDESTHKLFYRLFEPEDGISIKATLLLLHGMQEHSGRYLSFAQFLASHGIVVLAYDHLGHGNTAQSMEEHGFFVLKNAKNQVVIDAENMAAYLEHKYPQVPHFVLGHSMGSFIARCLLQQAHQRFDGAVIVGTGGKIKGIAFGKAIVTVLNRFAPRHKSIWLNKLFSSVSNRRFRNEKKDHNTNWLSVDLTNRRAFLADKLCGIPFSFNGFHTLISLNMAATKRNWAEGIMKKFPLLFVSGQDDPIGAFGKGVEKTVNFLQEDGFQNVSLKLYPNMRHEILNETDRNHVYQEILNWIEQQCS